MAQPVSNHIKIGSSDKPSLSKGNITVGVKGTTEYGPTSQSGFYNGVVIPNGGYAIYVEKASQGPSIHVPANDTECMFYLKKYGAPDGTVDSMLTWALTQDTILVLKGELTNSLQTSPFQNVSGTNGATGFFFGGFRNDGLLDFVKVGFLANGTGVTNAPVTAIDRVNQTITISGAQFVSGDFYTFSLNTDRGLTFATNSDGGLVGWAAGAASIAYSSTVIATYPIGSTITFQDNTTATITGWDDYGPSYIDIFWDTPKTGTIFPITLR